MGRLELQDASGRNVLVPLHPLWPEFDPDLQRWQQLPPGVILAHACALSCVWLVSELADIWPHGDTPGNADRTWRDALSAACALRHVLDVCNRDTRRQRRAQAARRSGWAIDDRNPDLHPATDFEAFDGEPVAPPLQREDVAGEPLEGDALRELQPSYHRAVLVAAGDALHLVDIAFDRAELFAGLSFDGRNEGWRRAVERCGSDGPNRLRQAWELSPEIIAGCIGTWQRPSIWPRDYWQPQWRSIRALLEAEMLQRLRFVALDQQHPTHVAPAVAPRVRSARKPAPTREPTVAQKRAEEDRKRILDALPPITHPGFRSATLVARYLARKQIEGCEGRTLERHLQSLRERGQIDELNRRTD